jgi:hypothetical protein
MGCPSGVRGDQEKRAMAIRSGYVFSEAGKARVVAEAAQ